MRSEPKSILALYPTSCGYAFAFFEKKAKLINWALRRMPGTHHRRNAKTAASVHELLDRYHPDIMVIENTNAPGSRRSARIRRLHRSLVHAAQTRLIDVEQYSRDDVRATFASVGAISRYEVAQAVGREFPALAFRLPRKRKSWESERSVMGIFAAVALALTAYRVASSDSGE